MTAKEWSAQYGESAELPEEKIESLKEEMKSAPAEILPEMEKHMELLRIMRYECLV